MSEEERKALADLKKRLEDKVGELQEEAALLREAISLIDEKLAEVSFKKASEIPEARPTAEERGAQVKTTAEKEILNVIYKGKNYGRLLVAQDALTIEPDETLQLTTSIRPFDVFFINKILEGMRQSDTQLVAKGILRPDQILSYDIEVDGPFLKKIIVRNYRERSRLKEILNGIGWTIDTMLKNMKAGPKPA